MESFSNRHGHKKSGKIHHALDKLKQQCYIVYKELETLFVQRELLSVNGGNFQTQNHRLFGLIEPEQSGHVCTRVFQLGKPFFYALETGVEKDKSSMPIVQEA